MARELQGPAVLGHCTDELLSGSLWELRLDLERDRHLSADLPREMRDDLVGDSSRIASRARGIELDGAVKAVRPSFRRGSFAYPVRLDRASSAGLLSDGRRTCP